MPGPGGRYRVTGRLGSGASGVVLEADDLHTGRRVALKTLAWPEGEDIYWLKQEFRALAELSHPNLLTLYELDADGDGCFFTMERIEGQHFDAHVLAGSRARAGRGEPAGLQAGELDALRGLLHQLAAGLAALHGHGRLHRDLKPSNVMVSAEGRLVLLDFGLVASTRASVGGPVVGSPAYWSPEAGLGQGVGPASDWFSVGVMLYEVLAGERPFPAGVVEGLRARIAGEFPRLRSRRPDLPADLAGLVDDLLDPTPAARPDAAAVLRRLGGASTPIAPAGTAPLMGRATELGALDRAAVATTAGAVVMRIHGPPGLGRTALVRAWLDAQPEATALALSARCHPRERVPFLALDGIVDGLYRELLRRPGGLEALPAADLEALAALFPVFRGAPAPTTAAPPERARAALARALHRAAAGRRLHLWIDDLHWGDLDSCRMLLELLREPPAPLLIVLSHADPDRGAPPLEAVLQGALDLPGVAVRALPVGPLDEPTLRALARARGAPAEAAAAAAALVHRAGGAPALLGPALRACAEADAGAPELTIEAALRAELERLPPSGRRLIEVLAVAGAPLPPELARVGAQIPENTHPEAFLEAAGLLRQVRLDGAPALELALPPLRGAALRALGPGGEARQAARLDEAARAISVSTNKETPYPLTAAPADDRRGAEAALAAGACGLAAERFARAAREAPPGPTRAAALDGRARALLGAGQIAEAAAAWTAAAAAGDADPGRQLLRQREGACALLQAGRVSDGLALLGAVLAAHGDPLPPPDGPRAAIARSSARARLRLRPLGLRPAPAGPRSPAALAHADTLEAGAQGLAWLRPLDSALLQARFTRVALDLGEPERAARALAAEAVACAAADPGRAADALEGGRGLMTGPAGAAALAVAEATVALHAGRFAAAQAHAEAALAAGAELAHPPLPVRTAALALRAEAQAWRGALGPLRRELDGQIAQAEERGDQLTAVVLSTGLCTLAWLAEDRPDLATRRLDTAMAAWPQTEGYHIPHLLHLVGRAQLELYRGRPGPALARLDAERSRAEAAGLLAAPPLRAALDWLEGRCALAVGDRARAGAAARRLARGASPPYAVLAEQLAAGVGAAEGGVTGALSRLGAAAEQADALDLPLVAAAARWERARLQGTAGARVRARIGIELNERGIANVPALMRVLACAGPG